MLRDEQSVKYHWEIQDSAWGKRNLKKKKRKKERKKEKEKGEPGGKRRAGPLKEEKE